MADARPNRKLTAKQAAFCCEYMIDLNATQAAIRAGYSKRNADKIGSQLLGKDIVAEEIKRLTDIKTSKTVIKAEDVIRGILEVAEDARQKALAADGSKTMVNHTAALKAYELLGKHLAMWTDKKEISGDVKITGIVIEGAND